ncbi:LacI family DNA-binding transcriptional regulator [Bacillus sp. FJAT-27245]|uniref:LacI family DNA-binding transcriptional regulator n=1 Tax=Bacillus sp. FJAT-27245 TaxID=1684144 RepID=UPI0006A79A2D|nr:LacI family DNA-binding transcriptional regulator [Bacillus sp. FJAT-27245]
MSKWTIKDIAKRAGVSITTVSRVLNQKEEGMSEKTREKVLNIIKEAQYQPNQFARGLVTKQSKLLGLIVPTILNPFFPELCRGAEDEANKRAYSLVICNSDDKLEKEEHYLRVLKEQQVDGIILSSKDHLSPESEKLLIDGNIPCALLDRVIEGNKYAAVFLNNELGGYLAGKHLTDLGHRNIACISGPISIWSAFERVKGFRRALREGGIDYSTIPEAEGNFTTQSGYEHAKDLLMNNKITALFACNDLMAFGAYQAAYELNIKVPEELSVIGFDDIPFASSLLPKLTTIRQDTYEMGRKAVELLINQIELGKTESVQFQPELIIRDSTSRLSYKE